MKEPCPNLNIEAILFGGIKNNTYLCNTESARASIVVASAL